MGAAAAIPRQAEGTTAAAAGAAPPPARVPFLGPDDLAPGDRDIYRDFAAKRGRAPSLIHQAMANAPDVLRAYMPLSNALRYETALPGRLRELAITVVGVVTDSPFEVEAHARYARDNGLGAEQVAAVLSDDADAVVFDGNERAVFRLARGATIGEDVAAASRTAREALGRGQWTELALQIAFYNLVVRFLNGCDIRTPDRAPDSLRGLAAPRAFAPAPGLRLSVAARSLLSELPRLKRAHAGLEATLAGEAADRRDAAAEALAAELVGHARIGRVAWDACASRSDAGRMVRLVTGAGFDAAMAIFSEIAGEGVASI